MDDITASCRLCLGPRSGGVELFTENDSRNYSIQISELFGVEMADMNEWPSKGCKSCIRILDEVSALKEKVVSSELQLMRMISGVKLECDENTREQDINSFNCSESPHSAEDEKIPIDEKEPFPEMEDPSHTITRRSTRSRARKTRLESLETERVQLKELKKQQKIEIEKRKKDNKEKSLILEESRVQLESSMKEMKLLECNICKVDHNTFDDLKGHMRETHQRKVFISCCDRIFNKHMAHDHMRYHLDKDAFKCTICDKLWMSGYDLKRHISQAHVTPDQIKFHCEICGKGFGLMGYLRLHVKMHQQMIERPFKCQECPKSYATPTNLKLHVQSLHSGEKPHTCEFCGKGFATKGLLTQHLKLNHKQMSSVECDLCGKQVFNIKKHKRVTHSTDEKFPCSVCGKECSQRNMQQHMRLFHSGKKFKCTLCEKEFVLKKSLQDHMNVHLGVKLDCYFCPAQATNSGNLVKHLKQVHPVEYEEYKVKKFTERKVKNV